MYYNYLLPPYMYHTTPSSFGWEHEDQMNKMYYPYTNLKSNTPLLNAGEIQNIEQLRNNRTTPQKMNMTSPFVNMTNFGDTTPRSCGATVSEAKEKKVPVRSNEAQQNVPMIPETLVTGAVNVASSAINTARSVLNMIVPSKEEVSNSQVYYYN